MHKKLRIYKHLDELFEQATTLELKKKDRFVIFSDLHMGDGSSKDDFKENSNLFHSILKNHYLKKDYNLVLNGDVEELQRFSLSSIKSFWKDTYVIFDEFQKQLKLFKTVGNHDLLLYDQKNERYPYKLFDAIKFKLKDDNTLFLFHGHQASTNYLKYNRLMGWILRYIANPLRIKNYTVAHDSRKQYSIEKNVYQYSSFKKVVSIIGHTHRPLFESLSKVERLRFKIEQLCRDFINEKNNDEKQLIKKSIKQYRKDLKKVYKQDKKISLRTDLYNSIFHIPCLFNSGCVIGKRGVTCLEIIDGEIKLVHWFDKNTSKKYLKIEGYKTSQLEDSDYYRMVINKEQLDYIFTRINFLA
ncbi:metallophosphoesterase [Marivirga sp.]|uniref:metallophosphoesterase n=1 Tax=Marivirga sp. TaxID=2018662 RepID=UPI003DA6F6DF